MPYKVAPVGSASHPPVGTFIDDGSLELVEVLGVGGYGVVYRAEDTCSPSPKSYAVKCLVHSHLQPRQRQIHIREIALHQIASAHPNVVTLHRVVETLDYTFIIMDYAPDSDLFTQILHNCRYLGDNQLIKHVFMQLLDAVEYCHSLGIYHRDLKPENILCFDGGLRIAITDFGLATTDKISQEFRTGSIYHMSPGMPTFLPFRFFHFSTQNARAETSLRREPTPPCSMTFGLLASFFSTSQQDETPGSLRLSQILPSKPTFVIPSVSYLPFFLSLSKLTLFSSECSRLIGETG